MNQPPEPYPAETLREQAQAFPYPPTPNLQIKQVRRTVWSKQLGWALALGIMLSLSIPAVRAQVGRWLQVGTILIGVDSPSTNVPLPTPAQTASPPIKPSTLPSSSLLGPPDQILQLEPYPHVQRLIWFSQGQTITLDLLDSQAWASKTILALANVRHTQVHEQAAIWLQGQRELTFFNPSTGQSYKTSNLSNTASLIWADHNRTYRLETASDLATMRDLAESFSQGE
ncbi:MAG TPA: hypothetical protein DEF47_15935 [Herpetosiphon sp.]|uniref:DUF4367 domain-containing protein n=1 Tax=Herpetosiphon aurantiacus (strain ATCC 23779 / DSM 785 / 114-95) TaxID=316274 RepID=A9B5K0_HERA2|nr:hypothetical protein [Herpetosiphon sp.]ABX04233.1 hypothetical protein Haur_1590 [Herpetosiphon aurantiacus DSM 785]HBW51384.1 hypothetical protein [Herpetosiphon sp.]